MAERPGPGPEDKVPTPEYYIEDAREMVSKRFPDLEGEEFDGKVREFAKALSDFDIAHSHFHLGKLTDDGK